MQGFEHAGVSPDILCTSKGLTAGYMPMSLTITTDEVYDAFYDDFGTHKAFVHSHTYAGNPMGCAIALTVLKIMKRDHILTKVNENGKYLHEKLMQLRLVSRAKCLLIENRGMTEAEAHHYIEKEAMNSRRTREQVAEEILEEGVPGG